MEIHTSRYDERNTKLPVRRTARREISPPYLKLRSSTVFILITICLAVFLDIFIYGIVIPVLPFSISERAGVAERDAQRWTCVLLEVYGAALLKASSLTGWLSDLSSSRRLPLRAGLVCLAGSTIILCLTRSIALPVLGRLFQGLSAAVVWTVGTALLVDTVGQTEIGQTLGYFSLNVSIGYLLAPLMGGLVHEKVGYYLVFYMAFGLITLGIILRVLLIEKKIAQQWVDDCFIPGKFDEADYMRLKMILGLPPLYGSMLQGCLLTVFDNLLPLFVQRVFSWGPTAAGLCFLAMVIPNFAAPVIGWVSDNYGPRWITVVGFLFAIPFWILLRLVTHNSLGQKVPFLALLALIGVALTLVLPPLMAEITYIVEAKERQRPGVYGKKDIYGHAYGLFIAAFAAGSLIGPIWSGYIEDSAGWGTMSWTLALLSLFGALPCSIWTGGLIAQVNAKNAKERQTGKTAVTSGQTDEHVSQV